MSAYDAATGSWVTMTTVWLQVVDAGPQQGQHLVRGRGVEGAGRLVGQDDRGVGDQRPGDRDALLLAAGELRGQPPAPVAEPDLLEQRAYPLPVDAVSGQPDGQPDVLLGGEVGHQVEALEDEADPLAAEPGAVLLAPVRDVLAGDDDAALGGPFETGGAGEERRLARPGGPHHRGEGAGREGEVDAGEGGDGARPFAVRAGEVVDLEGRAGDWVFMAAPRSVDNGTSPTLGTNRSALDGPGPPTGVGFCLPR